MTQTTVTSTAVWMKMALWLNSSLQPHSGQQRQVPFQVYSGANLCWAALLSCELYTWCRFLSSYFPLPGNAVSTHTDSWRLGDLAIRPLSVLHGNSTAETTQQTTCDAWCDKIASGWGKDLFLNSCYLVDVRATFSCNQNTASFIFWILTCNLFLRQNWLFCRQNMNHTPAQIIKFTHNNSHPWMLQCLNPYQF